jgi:hypothetical protein
MKENRWPYFCLKSFCLLSGRHANAMPEPIPIRITTKVTDSRSEADVGCESDVRKIRPVQNRGAGRLFGAPAGSAISRH